MFLAKKATLMRRSIVLSLPPLLVFPALTNKLERFLSAIQVLDNNYMFANNKKLTIAKVGSQLDPETLE